MIICRVGRVLVGTGNLVVFEMLFFSLSQFVSNALVNIFSCAFLKGIVLFIYFTEKTSGCIEHVLVFILSARFPFLASFLSM